jgi:hypothetical protein
VHQDASGKYTCALVSHETFITHNGDLDFYEWHGVNYPLEEVFVILEKVLQCKPPAFVDSMGVAGLLDLLRTKGLWFQSVRYAYIKGGLANVGNLTTTENLSQFWSPSTLNAIVNEFESRWKEISGKKPAEARQEMLKTMLAAASNIDFKLPATAGKDGLEGGGNSGPELLIKAAVDAFFDQDLYAAGKEFLAHAEGSFGLCLSSSVDASNEVVLGARGQTMSIAFWPKLGVLTWGSEAAATKTGLGQETGANRTGAAETDLMDGFRFDLDEVNGEIVRLCWDAEASDNKYPAIESDDPTPPNTSVMKYGEGVMGNVRITHCIEGHNGSKAPFMKRVLRMGGNPYVDPLPDLSIKDKVGADIADIPKICKKIIDDWDEPSESLNRFSASTLLTKLRKRLVMHQTGTHDGAVDLLITGMEVSLWCGEQFASDLHNAFPKLKIVTISSNKLLAQLGQNFPIPNTGFYFNENSYRFTNDTCAMLISHSGGTFGTLNVSNLLKGYTSNLFVVTSEWDTQVAKSVRAGKPGKVGNGFNLNSFVFTTFCGLRPAEPVSLTAVATHQLLTQILLYLMYAARYYYPQYPMLGGSDFTIQDVQELTALNRDNIKDLEEMVTNKSSVVRRELLAQGKAWSKHILEGPTCWIMSAIYILATVTAGYTPLSAIVTKVFTDPGLPLGPESGDVMGVELTEVGGELPAGGYALKYIVGVLDSLIYIFLPIWTAFLLRFIQGRPMLHRVAGRSLLIGDIPWVAQTLEAFVSKCFAVQRRGSNSRAASCSRVPASHPREFDPHRCSSPTRPRPSASRRPTRSTTWSTATPTAWFVARSSRLAAPTAASTRSLPPRTRRAWRPTRPRRSRTGWSPASRSPSATTRSSCRSPTRPSTSRPRARTSSRSTPSSCTSPSRASRPTACRRRRSWAPSRLSTWTSSRRSSSGRRPSAPSSSRRWSPCGARAPSPTSTSSASGWPPTTSSRGRTRPSSWRSRASCRSCTRAASPRCSASSASSSSSTRWPAACRTSGPPSPSASSATT